MTVIWIKNHPNTRLSEPESFELDIDLEYTFNDMLDSKLNNHGDDDSEDTTDYVKKSVRNQDLGKYAERWVLDFEKRRLKGSHM